MDWFGEMDWLGQRCGGLEKQMDWLGEDVRGLEKDAVVWRRWTEASHRAPDHSVARDPLHCIALPRCTRYTRRRGGRVAVLLLELCCSSAGHVLEMCWICAGAVALSSAIALL